MVSGGEVLGGEPERFEESDVVGGAAPDQAAEQQLADLAQDVVVVDGAFA